MINPPMVTCGTSSCGYAGGSPPFTWTDSNGNRITYNWSNGTLSSITDTLGTTALTHSGGYPNSAYWTYTSPSGASVSVVRSFRQYTVETNFGCASVSEYPATSFYLTDRITLPDGTYYQFSYEPSINGHTTGRVSSVRLPTGGTISYTYTGGSHGIVCADGSTAGITRATPDGTWQYTRSVNLDQYGYPTSSVTTATDPQNNQTVINFTHDGFETQRQVYTGAASGTPLKNVITCYNGVTPPSTCATQTSGRPSTEIATYTSLSGGPNSEVDTFFNGYGLTTETDEYDFGATTPTRKTTITYATIGNGANDRPAVVMVKDGAGNPQSESAYTYDEDMNSLQPSGAVQLFPRACSSGTCRGNITTVKTYKTASAYVTKTFTHYDTGQVYTATDVNNAVTTFTYGSCGNSLLTTLSLPLGLSRSSIWNCTGGVQTSSTDENGQTTSTAYTDPYFWRPANAHDASGNVTSFTYTGATRIESSLPVGTGSSIDILKTLDSQGRTYLSQQRQAPGSTNFDTVTQLYDSAGRPFKVSMPCVKTAGLACPATPATSTTYDGASRPLQLTDGGGGTVTYSYAQNDVQQALGPAPTGENTKSKQFEYDGLGRLTSVCEVTTASGSASCGQVSSKTGFWTRYKYDTAGRLTGVCQKTTAPVSTDCVQSPSAGQQTRTFSYDFLGRMTSETNPESGTTQYFYDTAPSTPGAACPGTFNGDLAKKYDANGNTTCYTYDALHRPLTVTYNGPNATPSKTFVYDSTTFSCPAGPRVAGNVAGRLAEAYTGASSSKITDIGFCYSARGEITDLFESTPHSGGYYHTTAAYWPNGAPQSMSGIPGLASVSYGVDGEGRLKTASLGTTSLVSNTTFNPASQPLTVSLGLGESASYAYDPNTGRMSSYTFTVGSPAKSMIGNLTWNLNGSPSKLAITDGFNAGGTQTCKYGDPSASIPGFDDLGRLIRVDCGSVWSQTFSYDPFGNITKSGSLSWQPGYNQSTNRYTLGGASYDAAGDLLTDTFHTYTWDALHRPATIDIGTCGTSGSCYTYDALGRVVERSFNSIYMELLYSPLGFAARVGGQNLQTAYFNLPGGQRAWVSSTQQRFWFKDWLGTARLASVRGTRAIDYDRAFAPFGEMYANFGPDTGYKDFTGDMQEDLGLLDLFDTPNRHLHTSQGRWISPDPAGAAAASLASPQTWNRYAYVSNTPLSSLDPLGLREPNDATGSTYGICIEGPACSIYMINGMPVSQRAFNAGILGQGGSGLEFAFAPGSGISPATGTSSGALGDWQWQIPTYGTTCSGSFGSMSCDPFTLITPGGWIFVPAPTAIAANSDSWGWNFTKAFFGGLVSSAGWKSVYHSFGEGGCDRLMLTTFAGDFVPFPTEPGPTDAIEPAAKLLSAATYNQALGYAATKGLTYPFKSSVFRGLMETSEGIEASVPAVTAGVATVHAVSNAGLAAYNGECH